MSLFRDSLAQATVVPETIQQKIVNAFPDVPAGTIIAIAQCESGLRQFYDDGSLVVSKTNDVGVMQINMKSWKAKADEFGMDLTKTNDNIFFARYLYNLHGLSDWSMSKHCWAG